MPKARSPAHGLRRYPRPIITAIHKGETEMEDQEIVCEVRYRLDPDRLALFEDYGRAWMRLIERHGGTHYGFFLPRDPPGDTPMSFAGKGRPGPEGEAIALFGFPNEQAYRHYRAAVTTDPDGIATIDRFTDPPFEHYERLFLRPVSREG